LDGAALRQSVPVLATWGNGNNSRVNALWAARCAIQRGDGLAKTAV